MLEPSNHLESSWITWHHLTSLDIAWHHLTSLDITWHHLTSFVIAWHRLTSLDIAWHHLTSLDTAWHRLTSLDITWHHLTSLDIICHRLTSLDITWHRLTSLDITWHHLTSLDIAWHRLTSLDIAWHRLTSLDITWHHLTSLDITWHRLTSLDIAWHHLTSLDITWHHLTSFDIAWHHLTSLDIAWHRLISLDITWRFGMFFVGFFFWLWAWLKHVEGGSKHRTPRIELITKAFEQFKNVRTTRIVLNHLESIWAGDLLGICEFSEASLRGIFSPILPMVTLTCSIAMMATTTGKIFGLNGTRKNAVRLRAEAALKKSRSSTRWFMCQCSTVLTITMCLCRCLPHPTSSTRTVMSICLRKSSMSTRIMNSTMTAMKATPIGSSDGLHTRSPGAVTTWPWDALALGMAATTSTLMSLPKEWDTHMGEFMIATLASPIGCRAGRVPRRTGAARNTTRAAWNSIAALVLSLDCSGFLRFTKAYYHESLTYHDYHVTKCIQVAFIVFRHLLMMAFDSSMMFNDLDPFWQIYSVSGSYVGRRETLMVPWQWK